MWAPEILLGETYNEKVDVYSYAMCLLELVDCNLPWSWCGTGAEVPFKVTRGERPDRQLRGAEPEVAELIKRCWNQDPLRRPSFATIVGELERLGADSRQPGFSTSTSNV